MLSVTDLVGQTVAFAASGGLDSCTVTQWLAEHGVRVVCMTADIAQPDEPDFSAIETRMRACGAHDYVALPLQEMMAEAGIEMLQFQAKYEGDYWNTTGIGRHVIVAGMVPEMQRRGITILAHGATGRGNDQVRFQLCTNMIDPQITIYAPWRDPAFLQAFRGRSEMIDYCQARGLPIKASKQAPYSTDANLLGLTHEAGELEKLTVPPTFVQPGMGIHPADAPAAGVSVKVRIEAGRPVALNDEPLAPLAIFRAANQIGGAHGIGIGTHLVENRFVGIKSRGVYEAPAMELLGRAYQYLIELILDRRSREVFDQLSQLMAKQIYQGYGFDLASGMARQALQAVLPKLTGTIILNLRQGHLMFHAAENVPHQLYSEEDASMEAVGSFDHADSEGFLRVLQVSARSLAAHGQSSLPHWA